MDYDAFNRRNAIMDRLIERRKVSSGEFAREFSVSRNTIASDIAHLSKIFPISSSTGRNGGYFYTGERFCFNQPRRGRNYLIIYGRGGKLLG